MTDSPFQWYRGDFHAHTNYSDGVHSPPQLVELARTEGLDFVTITDHNTVEAFSKIEGDPGILVVRGIEITLRTGDLNVFGVDQRFDWMDQICVTTSRIPRLEGKYQTTTELMRQISAQGLVSSMNHPLLKPWEWRDGATELGYMNCLEICNDPSWPDNARDNPRAVALWTELLNAGYRITGIGGSDYHRPVPRPGEVKPAERLGLPSTYVLAGELSSRAILDGLRRRQVYVTVGPRVSFRAHAKNTEYTIGDAIEEYSGAIDFNADISGAASPAHAQILKNGEVVSDLLIGSGQAKIRYSEQADARVSNWYRLDVRDLHGEMLAVTNPIFTGPLRDPQRRTFGDFVQDWIR